MVVQRGVLVGDDWVPYLDGYEVVAVVHRFGKAYLREWEMDGLLEGFRQVCSGVEVKVFYPSKGWYVRSGRCVEEVESVVSHLCDRKPTFSFVVNGSWERVVGV